ncbi:MAG: peptidylprolyl isomerase, partial [Bacillota bacterium]
TDYGYHINKMEKSTPEKQKPLTEVREEIVATLSDQAKQDKERQFVEEARKRAEIVNNLPKPADNNTEKKN